MTKPSQEAFDEVCAQLESGNELTLDMVGNVFQQPFWMLIVEALLDSQEAARAIQGAINRLRTAQAADDVEWEEDDDE